MIWDIIFFIGVTIWFVSARYFLVLHPLYIQGDFRDKLIKFGKKLHLAHHEVNVFYGSTKENFPWASTANNWEFEAVRKTTMLEF